MATNRITSTPLTCPSSQCTIFNVQYTICKFPDCANSKSKHPSADSKPV